MKLSVIKFTCETACRATEWKSESLFSERKPFPRRFGCEIMASLGSLKSTIFDREERKQCVSPHPLSFIHWFFPCSITYTCNCNCRQYQAHIRGLNAYDRHKKFINDYGITSLFLKSLLLCWNVKLLDYLVCLLVIVESNQWLFVTIFCFHVCWCNFNCLGFFFFGFMSGQ